jgi:hypothetical protein
VRRLTIACLVIVGAVAIATAGPAAAIVNKQLRDRKHQTFTSPAKLGHEIFDGSSKVKRAFNALIAASLLGAGAAVLAGAWQTMRGERGGLALTSSGMLGLIGLLAALSVVM